MAESLTQLAIDFSRTGNAYEFEGYGWSSQEQDHIWTLGRESALSVAAPTVPGEYALRFSFTPLLRQGSRNLQRLNVTLNGRPLARFAVTNGGESSFSCWMPWEMIAGESRLRIVFSLPDALPPSEVFEGNNDTRLLALAVHHLSFAPLEGAAPFPVPAMSGAPGAGVAAPAGDGPASDAALLLGFESLGWDGEFGAVQAAFGVHSFGLLRDAVMPLSALLAALESGFDGLPEASGLRMRLFEATREYLLEEPRLGILFRTLWHEGEIEPGDLAEREMRRLAVLRRRLLQVIAAGEKILVYREREPAPPEEILRAHDALRRLGPATLLWVSTADAAHPAGRVERVREGLMHGYVAQAEASTLAAQVGSWAELCRAAYRLQRAAVAPPAVTAAPAAVPAPAAPVPASTTAPAPLRAAAPAPKPAPVPAPVPKRDPVPEVPPPPPPPRQPDVLFPFGDDSLLLPIAEVEVEPEEPAPVWRRLFARRS
ncbi:MAG TPA: hypothetical protein VMI52_09155 [Acetobacteraceae bacterium]|nr:hypothetical protein [Acetobacteraceae bacterium]